jgi:hypothetical protein
MTPVEIFQPHYSHAFAKYIIDNLSGSIGVNIVEVGGGTGRNALHILNYFSKYVPKIYENISYTLCEISSRLSQVQQEALVMHRDRVKFVQKDVCQVQKSDFELDNRFPSFVIACEVIDNMPHDKVVLFDRDPSAWYETHVQRDDSGVFEVYKPVSDSAISSLLPFFPADGKSYFTHRSLPLKLYSLITGRYSDPLIHLPRNTEAVLDAQYIPTGTYMMFQNLIDTLPNPRFIVADFNELPPPNIPRRYPFPIARPLKYTRARRSPLVAYKDPSSGASVDFPSYLSAEGSCDIFFPSDFPALAAVLDSLTKKQSSSVLSSKDFLKKFATVENTQTMSGYNPMLEDFRNTSFLLN